MQHGLINQVKRWLHVIDRLVLCSSKEDMEQILERVSCRRETIVLTFVNAHGMNLLWSERSFYEHIIASDIILRDGVGMKLFLSLLGVDAGLNMNGTDFIPRLLLSLPSNDRVAVYGTTQPWLEAGAKQIQKLGLNIIDTYDGFALTGVYENRVARCRPSTVLLAMGMPKQESVAASLKLSAKFGPLLVINGGAIVDFFAGRFERAPKLMRASGLEWLYRFAKEPYRMCSRYIVGHFLFIYRIVICAILYWGGRAIGSGNDFGLTR